METKARFRGDQEQQFSLLAERLAALSDDELSEVQEKWHDRILDLIRDGEFRTGDGGAAWDEPVGRVEIAMADVLNVESNHRRGAIWHAEADMRGGHYVHVGYGNDPTKYNAYCLPYDEMCWEGPDHDTVDEAVEDGRKHNPGYEPELRPWVAEREEDE